METTAVTAHDRKSRFRVYIELARPFTLIAPMLGFLSGGLTAIGAVPRQPLDWSTLWPVLLGSIMAATLNAASNSLNQIFDLEIDRINKPHRPLPSGRMTISQAAWFAVLCYVISLLMAWFIQPAGRPECFVIVVIASILTWVYSGPPIRSKRFGVWANVTIAIPRGLLLKVAGWSAAKTILGVEPWYIGGIFGLFLLGASSTKDFADIEGDRANGCMTWPVKYGVKRAAWMIAPFFIFPFALIPLGVKIGVLTGHPALLRLLAVVLILYGIYIDYLILRKPDALATDANHVSWKHMYIMMFVAQIGFALAYLIPHTA